MTPDPSVGLSIAQALRQGAAKLTASPSPMLDARILLKFATGLDDAALIAHGAAPLSEDIIRAFDGLIERRAGSEPVAYIVGEKEFWSLKFKVTRDVLIPRGDSECLIEAIMARRSRDEGLSMLDLGVGSGCLICAALTEYKNAWGVGLDRSERALAVAKSNANALGLSDRLSLAAGDWLASIRGPFDVIIANPPYIPSAEKASLAADVSAFEPAGALFAGDDGLDDLRSIIAALATSPSILADGGMAVIEAGTAQISALKSIVKETFPTADIAVIKDLQGRKRGVVADLRKVEKRD